jgi:hypothetical protein
VGKREQARAEASFMRGDTGVDGAATVEKQDEAEVELGKAREQLLRGRTYLGREFLTWLLWRSEAGEGLVQYENEDVVVLFTGKVVLRGILGDVTELAAKGTLAPYSEQVRFGLDRGLLLHTARVRITHGEKVYEATLDAEFLDVRSAKLPELMSEEEDDRITERLYLCEQLSGMIDALVEAFLSVRTSRAWNKQVVPELKQWMRREDEQSAKADRSQARFAAAKAARAK